jgi:hypothetical protein
VKFRTNQNLKTTMKLYQFAEHAVNNILIQRSVMFHILYDTCVYCTSLMSSNSRGEEARQGGKEGLRVR